MRRRLKQAGLLIVIPTIIVLTIGVTYQGVATPLERRDFPPPGDKIDVGGHQLHIYCTGEGAPTVILEAPATGLSVAWGWIQPSVAQQTRVCSYDRAGLGWSEAGDSPYNPSKVPLELKRLLDGAKIQGPIVAVGDSLGALFVQMYASTYPKNVMALVLIDSDLSVLSKNTKIDSFSRFLTYSPWLARTGILRATRLLSDNANGLPEPASGALRAFLNRPDHLFRSATEVNYLYETVELAKKKQTVLNLTVVEIHTNRMEPGLFLSEESEAARVANIILDTVTTIQESSETSSNPIDY